MAREEGARTIPAIQGTRPGRTPKPTPRRTTRPLWQRDLLATVREHQRAEHGVAALRRGDIVPVRSSGGYALGVAVVDDTPEDMQELDVAYRKLVALKRRQLFFERMQWDSDLWPPDGGP